MLTIDEALALPAAVVDLDKPYLPLPNRVEVVLTSGLAPIEFTKTAFMLPIESDGSLIMAYNARRGLEFAGGHIELGESSQQAAERECFEETACMVRRIRPIGFLRMISAGDAPADYRYPHPVSFQQFFTGRVWMKRPFIPNDECDLPQTLSIGQARAGLRGSRVALYDAAIGVQHDAG